MRAVLVAVVLGLVACSGGGGEEEEVDVWQAWLDSPGPELFADESGGQELSRELAQARTLMGCEQNWIEGTVDYWLAETIGRQVCP